MAESIHNTWTWVRAEIGVGVLSLLLLIVPLFLGLRRRLRPKHGWNTFAEEFDESADGVFEVKRKPHPVLEWAFWPLLFLGVSGLWIGIRGAKTLQYVERGNELCFGSQFPKALLWYRKALEYDPDSAQAHHGVGNVFLEQGNRDAALHEFEEAVRCEPGNAIYHRDLAVLWMQYGNSEDAVLEYYRATALGPESGDIHAEFARLLVAKGKIDEAVLQYRIAIRYSHDTAPLHYDLANALLIQGKTDAALEQYSIFIDLNPRNAQANNNYGVLLYSLKRFPAAATAFRKATTFDNLYAEAYFNLGRAEQKLGHSGEAIKAYSAFLPLGEKSSQYAPSVIAAGKQLHILNPRLFPDKN